MNDKVEDLADEAGFVLVGDGKLYSPREDSPINDLLESFAELIVRECANVLAAEMVRLDDLKRVVAAQTLDTAQILIKNHFGVDQ